MKALAVCLVALLGFARVVHTEDGPACKTRPDRAGECRTLHGRLYVTNGIPLRLWVVGTKRILAVSEDLDTAKSQFALPQELLNAIDFSTVLYGDFDVCPTTNEKPGEMQWICIEHARNLIQERRDDDGSTTVRPFVLRSTKR